ncbi:PAS domain S-box-containing protein [Chitinophaga skermanii]|uniref:histidine kinase n=1 Tax=Chitinophaga skermanii TaxID=331697 RepID=A0A327QHB8_9BACT|nr:PAS domain-containing protein [Chitinophaga skermanii]RAJ04006.1 PAS domain S-box-containing protein [Chitinophaga skermanii]
MMHRVAIKVALSLFITGCLAIAAFPWLLGLAADRWPTVPTQNLQYAVQGCLLLLLALFTFCLVKYYGHQPNKQLRQYERLFYHYPLPMWVYDVHNLRFLAVNEAASLKYGYTRDEFMQLTIQALRHVNDIPKLLDDVRRTKIREREPYRGIWQHMKKNGKLFKVEIYSYPTRYDGKDARIVMAIDIDAEIGSMIKADDFGTRYELFTKITPDCIYYYNHETKEVTRNHGPQSIFGYSLQEVDNTIEWFIERIHPEDKERVVQSIHTAEMNQQSRWISEYRFRCANGEYKHVLDRAFMDFREDGSLVRTIGAQQDITERKHIIEQLQQQNKVLRDIAYINSHEIRSPLTAIMSLTKYIAEDYEKELPLNPELLALLTNASQNLDEVIHKIQFKLQHPEEE